MTAGVEIQNGIAVIRVDNPPVNALSHSVRQGLSETLAKTEADPAVRAVVLTCSGKTFIAGADIREFGQPPIEPHLPDLVRAIAGATKLWIAAIHGSALGGGLEIALACRFRIAVPSAQLGFPEVAIGAVPGAGGTVMLPRVVSPETALRMIASGKPISAHAAHEAGLVDQLAEADLIKAARNFAAERAQEPLPAPVFDRPPQPISDQAVFDKASAQFITRAKGQHSPKEAVRLVTGALTADVETALADERATFLQLRDSDQAQALRHIFFAERATTKDPRLKRAATRTLAQIGIVGGGTMGAGIAAACLLSGLGVTMIERDAKAVATGTDRVHAILAGSHKRGMLSDKDHDRLRAAFGASVSYTDLAHADLVIEAVFEDMAVKRDVFAKLDAVTRPDAILASNTSYLDLNEIARTVADPSRVIGLHFFSPAHIMKLLEIVVPDAVADDVLATGVSLAKDLRKIPVLAGVCDGFIANRIMSAYRRECDYMLEDGALPWEIDQAMLDYGLPMGIYQMQDLAGLDISWAMRKRQKATRDPDMRYVDIADKLCEMGRFGQKSGRGWYIYAQGQRHPDPDVEALIHSESARKSIQRQMFSQDAIMDRILTTMQNEGEKILAEGIARNSDDIDVVMVNAYGFPRWKGGPMFQRNRV